MALSIVSFVIALVALIINVSALLRRPRIVAEWGVLQEGGDHGPPMEGLRMIVTAGRRRIEVDELGTVLLPSRTWRRRTPEWRHGDRPVRLAANLDRLVPMPHPLQDGDSLRGVVWSDDAEEDFYGQKGHVYSYVRASGTVYLQPDSKLRQRMRARRRVGE